MPELIVISILAGLLAAAVIAWICSGIRQAGKDVDRIIHLSGQPEPCLAGNGQSMGIWIYCDLEVGHEGPHEGWMSALVGISETLVAYWDLPPRATRTKWTDFEEMPEEADDSAGKELA